VTETHPPATNISIALNFLIVFSLFDILAMIWPDAAVRTHDAVQESLDRTNTGDTDHRG
jgi:hypothetical protein